MRITSANLATALRARVSRLRRLTRRAHSALLHDSIRIEASSKCQLRCPVCPTGNGRNRTGAVGWGNLTFDHFNRFVEQNPGIRHVELSKRGRDLPQPSAQGHHRPRARARDQAHGFPS